MIKIKEYNDYETPVDGESIIKFEKNKYIEFSGKAFKVAESIWISPEPYISKNQPDSGFGVWDPTYCNSIEEKTRFLKEIIILLKRMNSSSIGQKTLELLSGGINFPIFENQILDGNNSLTHIMPDGSEKRFPASVIISPLQGFQENPHTAFRSLSVTNKDGTIKTSTTIPHIYYSPNITDTLIDHNEKKFLVRDPVLTFQHELTHALHIVYNIHFPEEPYYQLPNTSGKFPNKLEEYVTFGGEDRESIKHFINAKDNSLRELLKERARILNESNNIDQEYKDYFAKKYFLEKQEGKYVLTEDNFKFFRYLARDHLNEYNFAEELNLKDKSNYITYVTMAPYMVDSNILDRETYSHEKGYIKGLDVNENGLELSEKTKIFDTNNQDIIKYVETCRSKALFPRNRRSISNVESSFIQLEDEFYSSYNAHKIIKRSAVSCDMKSFKEKLLDNFGTEESRVYAFSEKIVANLSSEKMELNKSIKKPLVSPFSNKELPDPIIIGDIIYSKNNQKEYSLSKVSEKTIISGSFKNNIIEYNKNNLKTKLDAHRFNKTLDYKQDKVEFHTDKINLCSTSGDKSFTHSSYFPKVMDNIHNTTTALQLYDIISNIKNDFTINSNKDTIHKINDLAQATPFVSSALENLKVIKSGSVAPMLGYACMALNLGIDIYDKNYVGLAEDIGIFILLEAFPELTLPFMIFGYLEQWIQTQEKRKQIKNSILKLLQQRDDYININAYNTEKVWANILHTKIKVALVNIERQLIYNAQALIHNLKHQTHKVSNNQVNQDKLHLHILSLEKRMWQNINLVRKSTTKTVYQEFSKVFKEQYKKISLEQMKELTEGTKEAVKQILKENEFITNNSFVEDCLNIMNSYIKNHDIGKKLDKQIKELQKLMDNELKLIEKEYIPSSNITAVNNKIINTIDLNKEVKNLENVKLDMGRKIKEQAIIVNNDSKISIGQDFYERININYNFTISFWLKVPKNLKNENLAIIKQGINHNYGWSFGIKEGKIFYTIYTDTNETITITSNNKVPLNKWVKVSIINNQEQNKLELYIDTILEGVHNYKKKYHIKAYNNRRIIIKPMLKNLDLKISEFKTYYKPFNLSDITDNYLEDFDQNILYDYSGEPLRNNCNYKLINKTHPNYQYVLEPSLSLVLLSKSPHKEIVITIESKSEVIKNKSVVGIKSEDRILGLKIAALNINPVPYTFYEKNVGFRQKIKQISRLWLFKDNNQGTKILKLFSLQNLFIDDVYDFSAIGIVTPDTTNQYMSGVLVHINDIDRGEGPICMATSTYLNTSTNTSITSNTIPLVQPILDRGKYFHHNEFIESMSFYLVKKE